MGTALGFVLMWLVLKALPDCWRNPRPILLSGTLLQITAAATFATISFLTPRPWFLYILVLARLLLGLGGGCQVSLAWIQAARLTGQDRVLHNLRLFVAGCLGLGAGPLASSLATGIGELMSCGQNGMEYVLALVALIPWMQLCIYVPPIPAIDQMPGSTATPATSRAKAFVVCLCLAMLVFRNLSLAALEVGTAQLAQNKYGFESLAVGLLCAGIVFTSLPVQLLYERLRANKKFRISLHTMLWTGLVAGCLLIFQEFAVFYCASLVFFPMMALSSGLVMAKMQENAMPDGSILDRNTTTLLGLIMADFLGRGFGPVSARLSIASGGQKGFALMQVAYAALSLLLYWTSLVASREDASKDASAKDSGDSDAPVAETLPSRLSSEDNGDEDEEEEEEEDNSEEDKDHRDRC
ncbi:unnamed protein product [Symbiodinium pilosum]|uniref:Major facilitator superfamily (MFS) profile domain-containing protein n=1 Tax=Symbiodinium pilosum TaxID=2952 RepID=A0A812UT40_SYMPI|nr:unnamed protein product [Symbiodinium pilosum]